MSHTRNIALIWITAIVSTFLIWTIFAANLPSRLGFDQSSMNTVFANYDGPNYLIISKCLYDTDCIRHQYSLPLPLEYYPAHFPGYPLLISLLNIVFAGPWAMLLVTLAGTLFMYYYFYRLASDLLDSKQALILSLVLLFFPARLFVLRIIGAPETWFIGSILASIYYFRKNNIFLAAVFTALSQAFKSPGILLFGAYGLMALYQFFQTKKLSTLLKYWPFILVPITIISIFSLYQIQLNDFWAYFHSGDNFHLNLLPYSVFISTKSWINSIWLEEIIYVFFFAYLSIQKLIKQFKWDIITIFPLVFTLATVLVAHRDISRYIAPVYPFVILAFAKELNRSKIVYILLLLLPAVVLYSINFILGNTAPIADWGPYY